MSSAKAGRRSGRVAVPSLFVAFLWIWLPASATDVNVIGEFDLSPAGGNGYGVRRLAHGHGSLWVSDWGNDRVTAIDGAGNVEWSVPVGAAPMGLAADTTGHRVFVACFVDDALTVIDAFGWNVDLNAVPTGHGPIDVGVNTETERVYVANQGWSGDPDSTVTVVDISGAYQVIDTIQLDYYPNSITVDEANNLIWVTFLYEDHVSVIDGETHAVTQVPALSDRIRDVAIDLANDRMYLLDRGFNRVGVYTYSTRQLLSTIAVSYQPNYLHHYWDDDENLLYVTGGAIDIIDLSTHTVTDTLVLHGDVASVDSFRPVDVPSFDLLYVVTSSDRVHSYYPDGPALWNNQALARFPTAIATDGTVGRTYAATWSYGEPEASIW